MQQQRSIYRERDQVEEQQLEGYFRAFRDSGENLNEIHCEGGEVEDDQLAMLLGDSMKRA